MFAVHELGFLATRVDVAICANVMDFCVRRQPTILGVATEFDEIDGDGVMKSLCKT